VCALVCLSVSLSGASFENKSERLSVREEWCVSQCVRGGARGGVRGDGCMSQCVRRSVRVSA